MDRWELSVGCVLAAALHACAPDLRCYAGAVQVNGVCECPSGTSYVRAVDACEPSDSPLDGGTSTDAGGAGGDATQANGRDGSGSSCASSWILCGETCVDPRVDMEHCGGCDACAEGESCENGACVEVGCSDGTREAFVDVESFPTIAGCAATWPSASMRAERKLARCGNSATGCQVPADACAAGWHVCGNTADRALDITDRIGQADCNQQPGSFAAALGDQSCDPCNEQGSGAVCCGRDCVQQQGSCLWPSATAWFGVRNKVAQLCGKIDNPAVSATIGVMCCRDEN